MDILKTLTPAYIDAYDLRIFMKYVLVCLKLKKARLIL